MTALKHRSSLPPAPPSRPAPSVLPFAIAGLLLAGVMFGAAGILWFGNTARAAIGGPFTLEDGNGQTVTNRTFHGKYMLVYFGYTYCPDVCPTTLNDVTTAMSRLGAEAKKVQPVFITVDPQRDTPAVIKQYTAAFTPRLIGLTGTAQEIAQVAKEYHVYYAKHVTGPGPNDYTMDHSSILYLMGPDGHFIAPIDADESGSSMATSIEKMIS